MSNEDDPKRKLLWSQMSAIWHPLDVKDVIEQTILMDGS